MSDARRRIFICYRREDSQDVAGRIFDHLGLAFGMAAVFKDVDAIPAGADFREHLADALSGCDTVLVLIGPEWLFASPGGERSRLENPADYVRLEIATALALDKLVIPVLVRGGAMPSPDLLPTELRDLAFRHAAAVRADPDFRADMGNLIAALRGHLAPRDDEPHVTRLDRFAQVQPAARSPAPFGGGGGGPLQHDEPHPESLVRAHAAVERRAASLGEVRRGKAPAQALTDAQPTVEAVRPRAAAAPAHRWILPVSVGIGLVGFLGVLGYRGFAARVSSSPGAGPVAEAGAPDHDGGPEVRRVRIALLPPQDIVRALASSTLPTPAGDTSSYGPRAAFDGQPGTAWNEGAAGPGLGEWVEARFGREVRLSSLRVATGWNHRNRRGVDLRYVNHRLRAFTISHARGSTRFQVPGDVPRFEARLDGVASSWVRLTVDAVMVGAPRNDDLAISDIEIYEER